MGITLKVNARNDLHLPAELLKRLNLGEDRIVKAEMRGNALIIVSVDLEPRYTHEELGGLEKLHADEKQKGLIPLDSEKDIDDLLK